MSAFRVMAGLNPNPRKVYDGDDIHAALQAVWDALPEETSLRVEPTTHAVTGEPAVVFRDGDTGLTIAALYGITRQEWDAACAFWAAQGDDDEEPSLQ